MNNYDTKCNYSIIIFIFKEFKPMQMNLLHVSGHWLMRSLSNCLEVVFLKKQFAKEFYSYTQMSLNCMLDLLQI